MEKPLWSVIYTLTETQICGGSTFRVVDLRREAATGLPYLPGVTLKGAARQALDPATADILFGSVGSDTRNGQAHHGYSAIPDTAGDTHGSAVSVLRGSLLLYPLRSAHGRVVYGTSQFLLERLDRSCRSAHVQPPWSDDPSFPEVNGTDILDTALVGDGALAQGPLLLEQHRSMARHKPAVERLGELIGGWLPSDATLHQRVKRDLVVLPHALLTRLLEASLPMRVRCALNRGGMADPGRLWREKALPPDVLFWTLIVPQKVGPERRPSQHHFDELAKKVREVHVGRGRRLGQGKCRWHIQTPSCSETRKGASEGTGADA